MLLCSFVLFTACTKDDPEIEKADEVCDITLSDNTVYIDEHLLNDLEEIDYDNFVYYFNSDDPKITQLSEGNILLLHGLALRKVSNVYTDGDYTVVETEYATLNEAIVEGTIAWNKEIDLSKGVVPTVQMKGQDIPYKSANDDGFEFDFPYGDYTYRIKFTYRKDGADVEFEVSKDLVKPVSAKFLAAGTINNFTSEAKIEYAQGQLTNVEQSNNGLSGNLTLSLTVAGSGRDEIAFELPVVLLKCPVLIGQIPVVINVKVLFVINCVVPVDGSSQVSVKFNYDSSTGITYDGYKVTLEGSIGEQSMKKETAQTGASSGIAVNFGLAFPRLEISILNEVIVPYVQTSFLIGGDYTSFPACQQARSMYIGACGIDLSFLGFKYAASKTLWQEESILLQSGECN